MGIYLVVRLVSETKDAVTYQFAGVDHRFDRELTIRKADLSVTIRDGKEDGMARCAAGVALRRYRADGVWAQVGSHQA